MLQGLHRLVPCPQCDGSGRYVLGYCEHCYTNEECDQCDGKGQVEKTVVRAQGSFDLARRRRAPDPHRQIHLRMPASPAEEEKP